MFCSLLKYRRYLSLGYQSRMAHRFSVFCSIAVFMFPLVAKVLFWRAVYAGGRGDIAGFDMTDMVTYLLIFQFVFEFTFVYPGRWRVRPDIIRGGLTDHLLRPASYLLTVLFDSTGRMFPRWTSTLGIFAFLLVIFHADLGLPASLWIYPAGVLTIVLCYLLLFVYSFLLGLLAFWTESDVPFMGQAYLFFSGWIVPLDFLPVWIRNVADVLPFKYMLYFPTTLLMGKVTPEAFVRGAAIQLFWILLIVVVIRLVWKRGIRRYAAYGG